jgi:hypothetical protein
MDINKVQKLNNLAQNLERHNIAFDKDEAISQAESIYGKQNNYSGHHVDASAGDFIDLKKDVRKLTFALKNTLSEISSLKGQVHRLEKELNDARVGQLPSRKIHEAPKPIKKEIPVQSNAPQQTILKEEEQKITSPVDRNGIAPSDVSIEKYFYFGQK